MISHRRETRRESLRIIESNRVFQIVNLSRRGTFKCIIYSVPIGGPYKMESLNGFCNSIRAID
jgi:hypothetical protein